MATQPLRYSSSSQIITLYSINIKHRLYADKNNVSCSTTGMNENNTETKSALLVPVYGQASISIAARLQKARKEAVQEVIHADNYFRVLNAEDVALILTNNCNHENVFLLTSYILPTLQARFRKAET